VPTIDLTAAYRDANGNWKYEDLSGTVVLKSASWTTDPNLFTITVDVNNTVTGQVVPLTMEVFYYEAPADGINGSLYVKASFTGLNGNVVTEKFRLTELAPDAELVFATNHWGPGYRFILTSEFSPSIDYHFYSGFENVGTYGDISWRGCHVALGENYGFSTSGYYPMDFKTTTVVEIDPANPDLYTVYGTFVYSGSQGVIKYQNTLSQYVDHRQGILTFILNGVSTQYPVTSIGRSSKGRKKILPIFVLRRQKKEGWKSQ